MLSLMRPKASYNAGLRKTNANVYCSTFVANLHNVGYSI